VSAPACSLCGGDGGVVVHREALFRVVRVEDADFPAFYRVVCNRHVAEVSDLPAAERHALADAVNAVETVLRQALAPAKINLASLGNMVPHLHWHVLARFDWDSRFPGSPWSERLREAPACRLAALAAQLRELDHAVSRGLQC
jgi:diadenosine tetraphosphate (Ap4A) HIT family hydrolase